MALIPLKIPAGVYANGTDYEASGRWLESNLVRWADGSLRPVGGWNTKWDASGNFTAAPRAMLSWFTSTNDSQTVVGSANELVYVSSSGTISDITPVGLLTGDNDATINTAFGGNYFGTGNFGVKRPAVGAFQEADTWALDNFGDYLVGCLTSDGKLYEWTGNPASPAVQIANSPAGCKSMIVTEERFIFALQADGNPRKVAWCDRENRTDWTPVATNEAGDMELQTEGEIMCAIRLRGSTLILGTMDAHLATYQGAPYVYGFERVGTACGVASRKAAVAFDGGAAWMGREGFFLFNGSSVSQVRCDVADYVFRGMNKNQISKSWAVHNSEYGEIWWFFPSQGSTECDSYVAFDYREGHWEMGRLDRTCGVDIGIFDDPVWCDASGVTFNHELRNVGHGGNVPYAETSSISLGNGDQVMKVTQLIPDEDTQGDVRFTFKTRFYPNGDEREYGTYYSGTPTSLRFTGRQVRMRIEAANNNDFRFGVARLNVEAGGRR